MSKYIFLRVKEIEQETEDAATIHFWHPLNEVVQYPPGQFLTLLISDEEGKKVRRSYSMSSSPYTDVALAITVKRVPGGFASNWLLDQVKVDHVLEAMEPTGNFFPKDQADDQTRQVIFIGAGSGITPLFSILKSVLIVEPESKVVLIYGSRNEENIIFDQKLKALEAKYGERLKIVHSLSQPSERWQGETGRLNKSHLLKIMESLRGMKVKEAEYYLCGPEDMLEEAQKALSILGIPEKQIRRESFVTATAAEPGEVTLSEEDDALKVREITLFYEGSEYKVPVKPHESVLEAAMNLDIDLPYSCQAGRCTACLGRCVSGKVRMDEEDALSQAEIDEGFILTCVTHPASDDVVIEVE